MHFLFIDSVSGHLLSSKSCRVIVHFTKRVFRHLYPMEDSLHGSNSSKKRFEAGGVISRKRASTKCLVNSSNELFSKKSFKQISSLYHGRMGNGTISQVALFLLKLAALETVRRVSKAKCPFAWKGLQALQILCYPPFKWIQRWAPFKGLVQGVQAFSNPLLVLSIATVFSDQPECSHGALDGTCDSSASLELPPEQPSSPSILDTRTNDEVPQSLATEDWLVNLYKELEKQRVIIPERINEDELRRFYIAANGDFSCLLSSIKKTIQWRENYRILSEKELKLWSNLVFWHGFDMKRRPCLIVCLGLACLTLSSNERARFAQAVVSQIEHGVLHLVGADNGRITVLVDCEGLSPLRVPMQMMKSCASLLQDHFPNRLACLFIIRLPPVVRVVAQTFIQVLKPVTRQKLIIVGESYQKVLSEYIQTVPMYLGGPCTCTNCSVLSKPSVPTNEEINVELSAESSNEKDLSSPHSTFQTDVDINGNCDQVLRTAIIGILILWLFITLISGIYDVEARPILPP